ncbi:MAG: hypothetical protein MUE74_01015 [Bacteroidales bacterium]|nr:hypothetical protein [Bacteroidales bacterium]
MKRGFITMALLLTLAAPSILAQGQARERMESYRIAFFTQRLKLTPSEAEKFWPLYNDLQEKKAKIQAERIQITRRLNQEVETLSDQELTVMGDKFIELNVLETELSVKFHQQIKHVLPPRKVLRFYQAENQYKIVLLNQLQERREERLNPGQREK